MNRESPHPTFVHGSRFAKAAMMLLFITPSASAAPAPPAAAPPDAQPTFVRKVEKGFVDDPMAIDPAGKLLALIGTDSASFARIEILDLDSGAVTATFPLGDPQQIFDRLEFTGNGRELLLLSRDALTGKRSVQRFDGDGKPSGLIGPATELGFSVRGDKRYVIAWNRSEGKKAQTLFSVSAYDLGDLKEVGKAKVLQMGPDALLVKPPLRVKGWLDGYAQVIGQEPGAYDKATDMRLPDRAAIYDVLRGEFVWRGDIKDVYAWAAVNGYRARTSDRRSFLIISENQQDLELVDGLGWRAPLGLAVPFEMYDLRSLQENERQAAGNLAFSLAIDSLNPEALLRKKADKPKLDIYRVAIPDPGALKDGARVPARHLLRVAKDDRPVGWVVGAGHAVVLRKFKAFNRGGDVIELYRLD